MRVFLEGALLREIANPTVFREPGDTRRRARRGSAKDLVIIGAVIDPDVVHQTRLAFAERQVTQRALIQAALRREINEPTDFAGRRELQLSTQ